MKYFIKESLRKHLIEHEIMDKILDKINDVGYDSLTPYEKDILSKLSNGNNNLRTKEKEIIDWLDTNYGNLRQKNINRKTIGNLNVSETIFLDDNLDTIMTLENTIGDRRSYVIYIDEIIWNHLSEHFGFGENESVQVLKDWLKLRYNLQNINPRYSL